MNRLVRMAATLCFLTASAAVQPAYAICPYDPDCLNNPYGAGSPYKSDGTA